MSVETHRASSCSSLAADRNCHFAGKICSFHGPGFHSKRAGSEHKVACGTQSPLGIA